MTLQEVLQLAKQLTPIDKVRLIQQLTPEANQKIAEQLYYAISALPKMQIEPKKPPKPRPKKNNPVLDISNNL